MCLYIAIMHVLIIVPPEWRLYVAEIRRHYRMQRLLQLAQTELGMRCKQSQLQRDI